MKIDYALLADAAQSVGGKMFVLGGGWNIFRSANYPAPVQLAIAVGRDEGDTIAFHDYRERVGATRNTGGPFVAGEERAQIMLVTHGGGSRIDDAGRIVARHGLRRGQGLACAKGRSATAGLGPP